MTSLRLTLCLLVVGIVAAFPSAAGAFTPVAPTYTQGQSLDTAPPGYTTTGHQAIAIANGTKTAADATRSRKGVKVAVFANKGHWEVDYYVPNKLISEVIVSSDGHVERSWTGLKARALWTRGHYGHLFDNPLVFLPFALLFLAPFFDRRRPLRMLHFDLLAMLSFGVSYAFFTHAYPEQAVWLAYPPLVYLMGRMLWIGFGKGNKKAKGRLVPMLPTTVLVIGLVVLTGARIGLNIADNQVIDVGYASVVGADRIEHKLPLYVDNDQHGDTYGPVNYVAYVPFELIFPWHGKWDSLPSAHAASIFFDLMTILGLFLLGRRLRAGPEGKRLGLALAWGWAAYPFTLFALMENTNDALVAMLLVYTLLALTSPVARGGLLGLAAAAKFMPGALLPLIAFSGGGAGDRRSWRDAAKTVAVCCGVVAFSVLVYLPDGGLKEFWYCTLDFQLHRLPDFSAWGIVDGIDWTQKALLGGALLLSLAVAVFPRKRTPLQVAALSAAVSIALQIPAGHWFYFYIPWFVPGVLVALFARQPESASEQEEHPRAEVEPDFPTHRFERDLAGA